MKNRNATIAIIDYDLGNTKSVSNAIQYLGYKTIITSEQEILAKADILILPGVGAFEEAMKSINAKKLDKILNELVIKEQKPIIGICLGMQLLATHSEENGLFEGLNFIEGEIKKIIPTHKVSVPHVGWNDLQCDGNSILFKNLLESKNFYFDHSFYFDCNKKYVSSSCNYGGLEITASVQKNNIFGVQFHPEKSHNNGLRLFRSFIENI